MIASTAALMGGRPVGNAGRDRLYGIGDIYGTVVCTCHADCVRPYAIALRPQANYPVPRLAGCGVSRQPFPEHLETLLVGSLGPAKPILPDSIIATGPPRRQARYGNAFSSDSPPVGARSSCREWSATSLFYDARVRSRTYN